MDWRSEPAMAGGLRGRRERDDGHGGDAERDELCGMRRIEFERAAELPDEHRGADREFDRQDHLYVHASGGKDAAGDRRALLPEGEAGWWGGSDYVQVEVR